MLTLQDITPIFFHTFPLEKMSLSGTQLRTKCQPPELKKKEKWPKPVASLVDTWGWAEKPVNPQTHRYKNGSGLYCSDATTFIVGQVCQHLFHLSALLKIWHLIIIKIFLANMLIESLYFFKLCTLFCLYNTHFGQGQVKVDDSVIMINHTRLSILLRVVLFPLLVTFLRAIKAEPVSRMLISQQSPAQATRKSCLALSLTSDW